MSQAERPRGALLTEAPAPAARKADQVRVVEDADKFGLASIEINRFDEETRVAIAAFPSGGWLSVNLNGGGFSCRIQTPEALDIIARAATSAAARLRSEQERSPA